MLSAGAQTSQSFLYERVVTKQSGYRDRMDSIRALAAGYLPKELPPIFTTSPFANVSRSLRQARPDEESYPVKFSLARTGGLRRATEIPNPFAQLTLTEHCEKNWQQLRRLAGLSQISTSRPLRSRRARGRSLKSLGTPEKYERVRRSVGAKFTLTTDVSNFFPSVYTHAVDWAVRGKSAAKKDRSRNSVGGKLDYLLRRARGGQTVGISIGPDTSWLVSEVVLGRVDAALQKRYPDVGSRALRWVDDMVYYAPSHGQAEDVLGRYEEELSKFGLSLNPLKTDIHSGIRPYNDEWLIRLRQARYRDDTESHQADDIVDLFSLALHTQGILPNSGAISYAIKRCNPFPSGSAWVVFQELLLAAMSLESSSITHVFDVVTFAQDVGIDVDKELFREACDELILRHAPLEHGFEVAWALLLQRELGVEPSTPSIDAALLMQCNASNLLAWAAVKDSVRLGDTCDLNAVVKRAESVDALTSEDWLLAYEARARKWCAARRWDGSKAWRELGTSGTLFMDIPSPKAPRRKRWRLRRLRPAFATWGS